MKPDDDAIWKGLADPVRRRLLDALREGPRTTGDLCLLFDQTRFGVMKHLDVLEAAGLILFERRGRERWNFLNAVALKAALDRWLTPYQAVWADRLADFSRSFSRETVMTEVNALDIKQEILLPAPPEKIFAALTRDLARWWATQAMQTGQGGRLSLDPEIGGALLETNANGHAVIWARVEEIKPPEILYLSGRFGVKGASAGRIHFDIEAEGANGSRLTLTHQAVGCIGPDARAAFEEGWRFLLDDCLRAHLDEVIA